MVEPTVNMAPVQEDGGLYLDSGDTPAVVVSDEVAQTRANKAVRGVPEMGVNSDQAYARIKGGDELGLREDASTAIDRRKNLMIGDAISEAAKAKGGPLTPEETNYVMTTMKSLMSPTDTYSVFEEYFSKDYLDQVAKTGEANPSGVIYKSMQQIPQQVKQTNERAWNYQTRNEIINTELENAEQAAKNEPWGSYLTNLAAGFIPFRERARMLGTEGGDVGVFSPQLVGSAKEEQAVNLLQLNIPEFKQALLAKKQELKDDPALWVEFLNTLKGRSQSAIYLNNLFEAADVAGNVGVVTGVAKGTKRAFELAALNKKYNKVTRDLLEASKVDVSTGTAKEALGDTENAAVDKVAKNLASEAKGDPNVVTQKAWEELPSALVTDAANIKAAPGRLGREFATRLAQRTELFADKVLNTISDLVRVQNIPEALASKVALNDIKEDVKKLFTGVQNSVLDVADPRRDPLTNSWSFDIKMGNEEGKLFKTSMQAELYKQKYGLQDAVVSDYQAGEGYFIKINRPLDKTTDVIRDTFLKTVNTKDPHNFWEIFKASAGYIGGAEETLDAVHRVNRKLAAYGQSVITKMLKEEGQEIRRVATQKIVKDPETGEMTYMTFRGRRNRMQDWEKVIKFARDDVDPRDGVPGYFAKSPEELDQKYMQVLGRSPDAVETRAYFAYVRIVEADRMMRNISLYRDKSVKGFLRYQVHTRTDADEKYNSGFFEAKKLDHFPGGNYTMLEIGEKLGQERIHNLGNPAEAAALSRQRKLVAEGKKAVLEVWDADARPLKDFGSVSGGRSGIARTARPRYVLVDPKTVESQGLSFEQVPRRGGGHFEYDYDYYIKQAKVFPERVGGKFNYWYQGDTTIMPVDIRAKGQNFVKHLNEVRILIRDKKLAEAQAYVENNLHMDWDKIHGWFKPSYKAGKRNAARLDPDEPIHLVRRDQTVADIDNELKTRYSRDGVEFRDGTKAGSASRESQVEFTGQRDAFALETIADEGTRANPLYKFTPAKLVDPIPSLHRAVARMSRSIFMDDYKDFAVQRWIADAQRYLDVEGNISNGLKTMPYYYFHYPQYLKSTPLSVKTRLEGDRQKIIQFVGQPNYVDRWFHTVADSIIDASYNRFGEGWITRTAEWALPYATNPTDFLRGVVFHKVLGLFNVPQLLVQANTYANIAGLAGPSHAASGTYAAFMTQLSRINRSESIMKGLDNFITNHNWVPGTKRWKTGELTESINAADRVGYFNVQGEHTLRNSSVSSQLIKNGFEKFLDAGAVFFREGERMVRYGAWHTAYREFRSNVKEFGKLTDADIGWIVKRADDLSVNMTRASNSMINQGIFSVPAQFYTYQIRVMEQFVGNRLSKMDKTRLAGTYGFLYGLPTVTSLAGVPFADYIRRAAIERGYQPGDNFIESLTYEGAPAVLMALVTGNGDIKKGKWYNFQERYGVQGLEVFRDALRSDNTVLKIITGATGSATSEFINTADPFVRFARSHVGIDDTQFPITDQDIVNILKYPSGGNNLHKMITAINSGNIYSKKGDLLIGDNSGKAVSVPDAIFQYISGLSPSKASDLNLLTWSSEEQKNYDKETLKMYIREMEHGLQAGDAEHNQLASDHFDRARNLLRVRRYPEDGRAAAFSQAIKGKEAMVDRIFRNYYTKNAPMGQEQQRLDAYGRYLQKRNY